MKKLFFSAIALLIGLISCKKETSIEHANGSSGNFTARIDGTRWSASGTKQGASIMGGVIIITGISADNKEINITIADSVTGTYALNQGTTSFGAYADIDSSDLYAFATNQGKDTGQAGGVVKITQIDRASKTISGTFSFKVFREIDGRQKNVTEGVFTKMAYVTSLPPTSANDTLQASIDSKAWSAGNIDASTSSGQLTIVGASTNASQTVALLLPVNAAPGTYTLGGSNPSYLGAYTMLSGSTSAAFVATSGSITVISNNTGGRRIRGSFQFTGVDPTGTNKTTHVIANGLFSVQY